MDDLGPSFAIISISFKIYPLRLYRCMKYILVLSIPHRQFLQSPPPNAIYILPLKENLLSPTTDSNYVHSVGLFTVTQATNQERQLPSPGANSHQQLLS